MLQDHSCSGMQDAFLDVFPCFYVCVCVLHDTIVRYPNPSFFPPTRRAKPLHIEKAPNLIIFP
jgi:hypothetical protein